MLQDSLNNIIDKVEPFLTNSGFVKRGKNDFLRKIKGDYGREEKISFSGRIHRNDSNSIYVSCTIGIYYTDVRKMEKNFINDFILKYPIVAGSISHFSNTKTFFSKIYTSGVNDTQVITEIEDEIKNGAFSLLKTFPSLKSIYLGIISKHPFLSDYYQVYNERSFLTVACILLCLEGESHALKWIKENFRNSSFKEELISKIQVAT